MKKTNRAFELAEILIVMFVIGLLAAMAIPALQKVRAASIGKAIERGDKVSKEDREFYRKHGSSPLKVSSAAQDEVTITSMTPFKTTVTDVPMSSFQYILIKDKRYVLIPKMDVQETTIAGQTYWLIPTP